MSVGLHTNNSDDAGLVVAGMRACRTTTLLLILVFEPILLWPAFPDVDDDDDDGKMSFSEPCGWSLGKW